MIRRLVKLVLQPDKTDAFEQIFREGKNKIISRPGCRRVEMWRDRHHPQTYFTYSLWDSEADLNAYRASAFFGTVWPRTKRLLAAPPEAWSTDHLDGNPDPAV